MQMDSFSDNWGGSGSNQMYLYSKNGLNLDTWNPLVVTYKSSTYKMYINGLLVAESTGSTTPKNW